MDVKLESLIAKIKKDGIEEARKSAEDIISKAKSEAAAIVKSAEIKARSLEQEAEQAAAKLKAKAEDSLRQAGRDLILALKGKIVSLFERSLRDKTGQALSAEFMAGLITRIIDKWDARQDSSWEVLVSKADKDKLEKLLRAALKKEAGTTIEVKVSRAVDKGFRIGIKGEDLYYDFSDQSILEALKEFLNPSLSAILDAKNE
jgi:V/A-type H+-transporting ATPase subunit E